VKAWESEWIVRVRELSNDCLYIEMAVQCVRLLDMN